MPKASCTRAGCLTNGRFVWLGQAYCSLHFPPHVDARAAKRAREAGERIERRFNKPKQPVRTCAVRSCNRRVPAGVDYCVKHKPGAQHA